MGGDLCPFPVNQRFRGKSALLLQETGKIPGGITAVFRKFPDGQRSSVPLAEQLFHLLKQRGFTPVLPQYITGEQPQQKRFHQDRVVGALIANQIFAAENMTVRECRSQELPDRTDAAAGFAGI